MKIKHLTISLLIMLPALAALMGLGSCTDDYLYNSVKGGLEPGIPVEISLGLQVPEAEEAVVGSRSSTDTETDRTVYDLYLFIFDDNTKQLKTKYYFPQINSAANTACDPAYSSTGSAAVLRKRDGESKTSGTIEKIHTTTGPSRIVGVANCNRKGSALILEKLNKIKTLDELKDIMVSTVDPDSKISDFEQPLTVMSGYYCDKNAEHNDKHLTTPCDFFSETSTNKNENHTGYVNIDKEKLDGTLWLTPLQSRVKFIVLSEGQKDPANVIPTGKFELTSWQVYNLPGKTPLFCRGYGDEIDPLEPNPVKTLAITRFDTDDEIGDNEKKEVPATEKYDAIFGFNFFTADNHPGKGSNAIEKYGDRAKWTGDDYTNPTTPDKKHYTNAPAGATYVVLRGTYTGASYITEDGSDTPVLKNVTGDVTYTIFLGHDSGSGKGADNTDFNTYRNYKYTYIVRVSGVNKITVEVNKDIEDRPDAEGDIVTTTQSNVTLDAHYEQRVVTIKKQDVINAIAANNFQVSVTVPVFNVNRRFYKFNPDNPDDDPNTALPYMEWLEFYEHKPEENDRRYIYYTDARGNGTEKKTLDVKKFMKRLYEYANDENAPEELTFTVFFDEYLYETDPGTGEPITWQTLLGNGQSRRFTMLGTSKYSIDHNSSYTTSGTSFVQRCMQTIYDVDMAGLERGWATEVIEEDLFGAGIIGIPRGTFSKEPIIQWNQSQLSSQATKFGRQNCWRTQCGPGELLWNYKSLIGIDGYLTKPSVENDPNQTNLMSVCTQRNRDLNGNGKIDREELLWYVPSMEQLQLLYIGYGALTDDVQLYNAQRERQAGHVTSTQYESRHYLTSSVNLVWAEEGVSFSGLSLTQTDPTKWDYNERFYVRCARSVGTSGDHENDVPWDLHLDKFVQYQFESIFEYTPYTREIEETEDGEIAKFKNHKRGRITMRYLNPQSLINVPRFTETPGRVHSFSENNFPTFQFEIADTVIAIDETKEALSVTKGEMETLFTNLETEPDFSPCNIIGPGWRLPTITELTVMQWAWNQNWTANANISQDFINDPAFKKKFPNITAGNISNYLWHAFVGSDQNVNLLSRTHYYYRFVGANGLTPTFNDRVRTYHVFEKTGGSGKFSIDSRDLSTHAKNMAIRCVRSYTTAQANAPAQSPAATRAAVKRGVRKK